MSRRSTPDACTSETFLAELARQRWDDHRYYHHSRVNQSLHLVSALSFLCSYVFLVVQPVLAPLVGWIVAMSSRQVGHFFFEPKGYDAVNGATHEHKEAIKVGYNLRRKIVLLSIWGASPVILLASPGLGGLLQPHTDMASYTRNLSIFWLALGAGGLAFRTLQLFFLSGVQTGLVWCTKILTDPFHDVKLYYKAPLRLLRGELIDPMHIVGVQLEEAEEQRAAS